MPFLSRKALTLTSCDLMVLLRTVACCAMVAPPRNTTPDSIPASARQTSVSRSECGSLTIRPSRLVMVLSATPSNMPAKIRNSVAAKYQVNSSSAAKATAPMPPTDIAHARSLRARSRSSAETATLIPLHTDFRPHSLAKRGRDQARKAAGLTLKRSLCKARSGIRIAGRRGTDRHEFQIRRTAPAAGRAGHRRPDQDQPARAQIPPDRRGGDARRRQIGLRRHGGPSRPQL